MRQVAAFVLFSILVYHDLTWPELPLFVLAVILADHYFPAKPR